MSNTGKILVVAITLWLLLIQISAIANTAMVHDTATNTLTCDIASEPKLLVDYNKLLGNTLHYRPESVFNRWVPGDVHVSIEGFDEDLKAELIVYTQSVFATIKPKLDINLVFDDNIVDGGIEILYGDFQGVICASTRNSGEFNLDLKVINTQLIRIQRSCIELFPEGINRDNAIKNIFLHEFNHALFLGHIKSLRGNMPIALMNPYISTDKLYFTFNDEQKILTKYGVHGRTFNYDEDDIGKTQYLLYTNEHKSISFPITDGVMVVDWLKKNHKPIKKEIE